MVTSFRSYERAFQKMVEKLREDLFEVGLVSKLWEIYLQFATMLSDTEGNSTLNHTAVQALEKRFADSMLCFSNDARMVHSKILDALLKTIRSEIQESEELTHSIKTRFEQHQRYGDILVSLIKIEGPERIDAVEKFTRLVHSYGFRFGTTTIVQLKEYFRHNASRHIDDFQNFTQRVRENMQGMQRNFVALEELLGELLERIWKDETHLEDAYQYFSHSLLRRDQNETLRKLKSDLQKMKPPFQELFNDRGFQEKVDRLRKVFSQVGNSELWDTYFRDNMINLDIYFQDRSYEQVTQQVAYDIFALLSDIGGSVGLCLGASVITVFELMDLILQHIISRIAHVITF